jgi:hypothetical protein
MKMNQVDATSDSEWNFLVVSNTKVDSEETTQEFVAEASLLTRKWQDKVGKFQVVKQKALELVLELGPSFEEVKEEKSQTKDPKEE